MTIQKLCPACGVPNTGDSRFCGRCGSALDTAPPAILSSQPVDVLRHLLPSQPPGAPAAGPSVPTAEQIGPLWNVAMPPAAAVPQEASAPSPRDAKKTILGLAIDPIAVGLAAAPAPASTQPTPVQPTPVQPTPTQPVSARPPSSSPPAAGRGTTHKTMLGMPAASGQEASAAPSDTHTSAPPSCGRRGQRTMLGMAAPPQAAAPQAAPPQPEPPQAAPAAPAAPAASAKKKLGRSQRTMLGVAAPTASATPSVPPSPLPTPSFDELPEEPVAGVPSKHGLRTALLALLLTGTLLIALSAVGYLAYQRLFGGGPSVRASVVQTAEGETMRLEFSEARPNTEVRYAGQSRTVTSGAVDFPIQADALRIGDNHLEVDVVEGGSTSTSTIPITLTLEYRARTDLAGLEESPATIAVVIEAVPGSSATVQGTAVTFDAEGRGRHAIPLSSLAASPDDGSLTLEADYELTPPGGQPARGRITTRIPRTPLVIVRPINGGLTDASSVLVEGRTSAATEGDATQITVDGASVTPAADGSFEFRRALDGSEAAGRITLHVVARRRGNAPHAIDVAIERVADLSRVANDAPVDRSVGYPQLVESADAVRGHTVAFEGQVYNADIQDGVGILQLLVRGCSRTDRCPLWVTYRAVEPIVTGANVRVVGAARGMQEFRAESGEARSVPHVEASVVVPLP